MYHLSIQPLSRSKGRSAPSAAAYRSADIIFCERTGVTHNYSRKGGVEHTELVGWKNDRASLWNAAEAAENRGNARVARECLVALPHEANAEERRQLAVSMAEYFFEKYKVAVDVAVHHPSKRGDQRNYHAHLLFTTRIIDEANEKKPFGKKTRVLDDRKTGPEEIEQARSHWADLLNQFYKEKDEDKKVDHRSYERQGLDLEPTVHLGPAATALERRGIKTQYTEDESTGRSERIGEADSCTEKEEQRVREIATERAERHRRLDGANQDADCRAGVSQRVRTTVATTAQSAAGEIRESESFLQRVRKRVRKLHSSWRSLVFSKLHSPHRGLTSGQRPLEGERGIDQHKDDGQGTDVSRQKDTELKSGVTPARSGAVGKKTDKEPVELKPDKRGFFRRHWDRISGEDERRKRKEEIEKNYQEARDALEALNEANEKFEAQIAGRGAEEEEGISSSILRKWPESKAERLKLKSKLVDEESIDVSTLDPEFMLLIFKKGWQLYGDGGAEGVKRVEKSMCAHFRSVFECEEIIFGLSEQHKEHLESVISSPESSAENVSVAQEVKAQEEAVLSAQRELAIRKNQEQQKAYKAKKEQEAFDGIKIIKGTLERCKALEMTGDQLIEWMEEELPSELIACFVHNTAKNFVSLNSKSLKQFKKLEEGKNSELAALAKDTAWLNVQFITQQEIRLKQLEAEASKQEEPDDVSEPKKSVQSNAEKLDFICQTLAYAQDAFEDEGSGELGDYISREQMELLCYDKNNEIVRLKPSVLEFVNEQLAFYPIKNLDALDLHKRLIKLQNERKRLSFEMPPPEQNKGNDEGMGMRGP